MKPWLRAEELGLLRGVLLGKKNYAEFGMGGSTLLAKEYAERICSVESNADWIAKVGMNAVYVDINADPDNWGWPKDESKRENWPQYSSGLDAIDWIPDVILVDGRFRVACALKSIAHMSSETLLLIHDYVPRKAYHVVEKYLNKLATCNTFAVFAKGDNTEGLADVIAGHEYMPL